MFPRITDMRIFQSKLASSLCPLEPYLKRLPASFLSFFLIVFTITFSYRVITLRKAPLRKNSHIHTQFQQVYLNHR